MQNHRLGIHSDKIWADSTTKNTLKYHTTASADLPNRLKYLGYLKKKLSLGVRSPCDRAYIYVHILIDNMNQVKMREKWALQWFKSSERFSVDGMVRTVKEWK